MEKYLVVVSSVIIFLAVFEGVLPSGKFGKMVKTVVSMVVTIVILTPIVNIFNNSFDYETIINSNDGYVEYLNEYKKITLEKEVKSFLLINGLDVESVFVTINENNNLLEILIKKDELNSESEHINILEKAKNLVIERFYLSDWEISVG